MTEQKTTQDVVVGLNIICPECQMERPIKDGFDTKEHFMTTMGCVIHHLDGRFRKQMHDMISIYGIDTIRLVMNPNCSLLKNALAMDKEESHEAEKELRKIYCIHKKKIDSFSDEYEKRVELAKLNLILQAAYIKKNAFLDLKIESGLLELKGVLYHAEEDQFEEVFTTSG